MTGKQMVIVFATLLFTVGAACADDFDDCKADCRKAQQECIDGITLFDATGIAEAKAACIAQFPACDRKCHEIDAMGQAALAEQKRLAEEAEKKRQQESTDQDGIRSYNFDSSSANSNDGGIKSYNDDGGIKSYVFQ